MNPDVPSGRHSCVRLLTLRRVRKRKACLDNVLPVFWTDSSLGRVAKDLSWWKPPATWVFGMTGTASSPKPDLESLLISCRGSGDSDEADFRFWIADWSPRTILVQGHEPAMLRPLDSEIQTNHGAGQFLTKIIS